MAVKKVNVDNLPAEVLGDLKTLIPNKNKEYICVGSSYYELYPLPATKLLEVLGDIIAIFTNIKREKERKLREAQVEAAQKGIEINLDEYKRITYEDIASSEETITKIKQLIPQLLEGVDEEDYLSMSIGQLIDTIQKVIIVNLNTLPRSTIETMKQATEVSIDDALGGTSPKNPLT